MSERKAYPVLIKECANDFLVFVPDLEIYTEGDSFPDAIVMARDAIGLKLMDLEDDSIDIPEPSTTKEALDKARKDADEDFDYSDGVLTFVDVDYGAYRNRIRHHIIPYLIREVNPQTVDHIAEAAFRVQEADDFLEEECRRRYALYAEEPSPDKPGALRIRNMPPDEHPAMQKAVLKEALARTAGGFKDIEAVHIGILLGYGSILPQFFVCHIILPIHFQSA